MAWFGLKNTNNKSNQIAQFNKISSKQIQKELDWFDFPFLFWIKLNLKTPSLKVFYNVIACIKSLIMNEMS